MSRVSQTLRAALRRQLSEMYAFAEHYYASFENEAKQLLDAGEADYLARYAIRCWWLDAVDEHGEAPSGWEHSLVASCRRTMADMHQQLADQASRQAPWITVELLVRTACVLQRRSHWPVTPNFAAAALHQVGRLATLGVVA